MKIIALALLSSVLCVAASCTRERRTHLAEPVIVELSPTLASAEAGVESGRFVAKVEVPGERPTSGELSIVLEARAANQGALLAHEQLTGVSYVELHGVDRKAFPVIMVISEVVVSLDDGETHRFEVGGHPLFDLVYLGQDVDPIAFTVLGEKRYAIAFPGGDGEGSYLGAMLLDRGKCVPVGFNFMGEYKETVRPREYLIEKLASLE